MLRWLKRKWKMLLGISVPVALAGAFIVSGPILEQPKTLTKITLLPQDHYFAIYEAPDGSRIKEEINQKEYDDLSTKGNHGLTKNGYTWISAYKGKLYDNGSDHLDKGEYTDLDASNYYVFLDDVLEKEPKKLDKSFITNDVISVSGIQEVKSEQ